MEEELLTYKVDGQTYDIPPDKEQDFMSKYPKAERLKSYVVDKDTFDIPMSKEADFMKKYPDAQATFGVKKKDAPSSEISSPELSPSPIELEDDSPGAAIRSGDIKKSPFLVKLSEQSPAYAAPINHLVGAVHGAETSMPIFDGAQKAFYRGIGAIMEANSNPSIAAAGMKLINDQDTKKSWFKKAEEAINEYRVGSEDKEAKLPPRIGEEGSPYKKDKFSDLSYGIGELYSLFATLAATPEAVISGVSAKLALNFFATNALKTYSETDNPKASLIAGLKGGADGLAFSWLGLTAGKGGAALAKLASKVVGRDASSFLGSTSVAPMMYGAG